jgi:hypothetical protein
LTEQKKKVVKTVEVEFDQFAAYDFIPPATYFIRDARDIYVFYKTSKRNEAQEACDDVYGKSKYSVMASKLQKTESRLESGGLSVYATATRQVKR